VVDVGAVVIEPDFLGPRVFAGFVVIEEVDIRFDALRVEDAGGEAKDGGSVVFEEVLADGFAGSTFKEHVVGDNDGGAAGGFQHAADVLKEVELFVGSGGPEVLAVVREVSRFLLSLPHL
jgi:hypothetical protein